MGKKQKVEVFARGEKRKIKNNLLSLQDRRFGIKSTQEKILFRASENDLASIHRLTYLMPIF